MHSPLIEWIRATSLRTRLTLWNTAVVILLTTVTLLIVRFSARSVLYADCDAELRAASREIALAVQELSGDAAPLVAELRRKAASHEERGWFLHLLTLDGATVWKSDHCPADVVNYPPKDVEQVEVVRQVGHYRYVRNRIDRPSGESYLVRVGTYTTGLDDSLAGLIRLLTGMGLGLSLITPFAAYWLAGRATQPMGAMLRTAERLSPSRLGDRLPIKGGAGPDHAQRGPVHRPFDHPSAVEHPLPNAVVATQPVLAAEPRRATVEVVAQGGPQPGLVVRVDLGDPVGDLARVVLGKAQDLPQRRIHAPRSGRDLPVPQAVLVQIADQRLAILNAVAIHALWIL